jgi:putative lipoic acid-binding regulatory protein
MEMQDATNKKVIIYPAEITFKVIFKDYPSTLDSIKGILSKEEIEGFISITPSKNSKFISYTITAVFPSEECLNNICNEISAIAGYMTMF